MAALPSIAKTIGGAGQSGFTAQGVNPKQLKTSYNQTQEAIKQQQDFLTAIKAQNGIQNQSDVFAQQQALAGQLQNLSQGVGPNPAQAALNQATGQNVANQAALMAGQRGASANTGLIARQAGQQGAATQQQAAGQSATLQAQQQIAAMNALQNQQAQMAGLATNQVGEQQTAQTGLGQMSQAQYGAMLGQQQAANQINAQVAAANAGAKGQMIGNLMGAAGTAAGMYFGGPMGAAAGGQMGQQLSGGGGGMTPNSGSQMQSSGQMNSYDFGNGMNFDHKAEGGQVSTPVPGPRSRYGKSLHGIAMAEGGKVPALVSPGEVYLTPKAVSKVAEGKKAPMDGEKIPGKPKVSGSTNSYANDTVEKTLQKGGIVLPRSVTQSSDADAKAAAFVKAILAKKSLPHKK